MNFDKITVIPSVDNEAEDRFPFEVKVYINDEEVKCFTNIISFFAFFDLSQHKDDYFYNEKGEKITVSEFYPFGCSCGSHGCNGIYNGIYLYNRKFSVEWKIDESNERSYERLLSKKHYVFEKDSYRFQILRCWRWMKENIDSIQCESDMDNEIKQIVECMNTYEKSAFDRLEHAMKDLDDYNEKIKKMNFLKKYSRVKHGSNK